MRCPHCQFDHPASVHFCGMCGGRLVPECRHCGRENPLEFRFCGQCGARLGAPEPSAEPAREAAPWTGTPQTGTSPAPPASAHEPVSTGPAASTGGKNPTARGAAPTTYTPTHLAREVLSSKAAQEGERKQVTVLFCDIVNSTATADAVGAETMHGVLNQFFEMALAEVHRYEGTINQFLGDGFMALFGAPIAHEDHARRAVLAALALRARVQQRREEFLRESEVDLQVRMGLNTGLVVVGGIGDNLRMDYTAVGDTTNLAARMQSLAEPGTILVSETTYQQIKASVRVEVLEPASVKGKKKPVRPYLVVEARRPLEPRPVLSRARFVGRERELAVLQDLWEQATEGHGQVVGVAGEPGSGKSRLVQEFQNRLPRGTITCLQGRCLSYGTGIPYLPLSLMLRSAGGLNDADGPEEVQAKLESNLETLGFRPGEHLPYLLRLLDAEGSDTTLEDLEPQIVHRRTFASLRKIFFRASELRPVILEVEDLHWADATSEDFLSRLVEGVAHARILLLLTYRSGYQPSWMEKSYATQITMRRLSHHESREMVSAYLDGGKVPEALTDEILEKAEGNPFFLEELARSMNDRSDGDEAVPDTVQGLIMARMDRLPEEHKRVIQTASVLGREFSLDLLYAVWQDAAALDPLMTDLQRWEFFYEDPTAEDTVYVFHHALTQEVAYQTLLSGRRQDLHRSAGRALEALYADRLDDALDRIAYHYPRANEPEKAVDYLTRAAEKAARGYAHSEAAKALQQALELTGNLPAETRDRQAMEVVLALAESMLPLAQLPETLEVLDQHRGLLDTLEDDGLAARFHFWLAHTYSYLGNSDGAAEHAHSSIEAAERSKDPRTAGQACYVLCREGFWTGKFADGLAHGLRALELLEGERWWQGQTHWVNGFHHFVLGRFDLALESMEQAREIGEDLGDPRLDTSWSTGYFLVSMGDLEAGIAQCRGGLARARDPLNTAAAQGFLGYAYLEQSDLTRAIPTLEDASQKLQQAGMQQLFGWFSIYLGEAYLAADRHDEARQRATEGLEAVRAAGFRFGEALGERALGRIALGARDVETAEQRLTEALVRFTELEAPFERAWTLVDLARSAHAGNRPEEVSRRVAEAREVFEGLGAERQLETLADLAAEWELAAQAG